MEPAISEKVRTISQKIFTARAAVLTSFDSPARLKQRKKRVLACSSIQHEGVMQFILRKFFFSESPPLSHWNVSIHPNRHLYRTH